MENKTSNELCPYLDNFPCFLPMDCATCPIQEDCQACPIEQAESIDCPAPLSCTECPAYYLSMPIPHFGKTLAELDGWKQFGDSSLWDRLEPYLQRPL